VESAHLGGAEHEGDLGQGELPLPEEAQRQLAAELVDEPLVARPVLLEAAEEAPLAQAELAGQELRLWNADAQALEDGAAHLIEKALLRGELADEQLGEPL
jgi:hypothetical protein